MSAGKKFNSSLQYRGEMSESDQLLVLFIDVDCITVLGGGVGSFYWKFPGLEELFFFLYSFLYFGFPK